MKITDLEQFAYTQIIRPYWPELSKHVTPKNAIPIALELLTTPPGEGKIDTNPSGRATLALARLKRIGVQFPPYIQHPLVTLVEKGIEITVCA